MIDASIQASHRSLLLGLRQLVRRAADAARPARPVRPPVVAWTGYRGIGVTTAAVTAALALARGGYRTILIDADPTGPEATRRLGLTADYSLGHFLRAERDLHEVITPGPSGLLVVPGTLDRDAVLAPDLAGRLETAFDGLDRYADVVLVDLGDSSHPLAFRLWEGIDRAVIVSGPDEADQIACYVQLRDLTEWHPPRSCGLTTLIRSGQTPPPSDTTERIRQAARQFLGLDLALLGEIGPDTVTDTVTDTNTATDTATVAEDPAARSESGNTPPSGEGPAWEASLRSETELDERLWSWIRQASAPPHEKLSGSGPGAPR